MRVLWFATAFHPQSGGVITYTDQLTRNLARQRHHVGLVTAAIHTAPEPGHVAEHFSIPFLDVPTALQVPQVRQAIGDVVGRFRPDIVHCASAGLAVYSDQFPRIVPIVATIHGNDLTKPWQRWPLGDPTAAIGEGLKKCDALFCVSRHTRDLVAARGLGSRAIVVPNGCDTETFVPRQVDRRKVLSRYGIRDDRPIVLTVARLVPRKGHLVAMEAMRRVGRPLHWVVVGEGHRARAIGWSRLLTGQSRRVSLLGRLPLAELVDLYNACDIFLLAPIEIRRDSMVDSEGFGLTFLEAGACGKPPIASNVSGCVDAVIDGETGLLVTPGDPDALAGALRRLIDDPSVGQRLGEAACKRIHASGGWRSVAEEVSRVYAAIAAKRNR
jgi:phosphatidyl-myo-inositol dimannoside synthase